MRVGRIARPTDVPSRCDKLLSTLEARSLTPKAPATAGITAALAVHCPAYIEFLWGCYEEWSALPDAGPEVLPNLSPYWNAQPGKDRAPCRPGALVARAGHYLGDLSVPMGQESWRSILAASNCAASAVPPAITPAGTGQAASATSTTQP
jgi:acetoin utilization deacetylase AcuC-like enzyme